MVKQSWAEFEKVINILIHEIKSCPNFSMQVIIIKMLSLSVGEVPLLLHLMVMS